MNKIKDIKNWKEMINKVVCCNNIEGVSIIPDNSIDTIITDPPYGLSFMGKKWDYDVPSVKTFEEMLRACKPGATMLCFAGSRTQHRMAINIEDAGWILKDCIMWLYGSGFPKATDISKQLDKGHERKVVGKNLNHRNILENKVETSQSGVTKHNEFITTPATPEAQLWNGWKSHGLKPSYEPVLWATKPLTSSSDYDTIIVELNNYIELLLWQSLAKLEKMDTSRSLEMASTLLNIALLWNNILNASFPSESKFIILTETGLITELRTLKYLILENTQVKDILERSKALGSSLSALIVERSTRSEKKNTKDILSAIVQENAISTLKENGMFAELVKNNSLLPILSNLSFVLKSATTSIGQIPKPSHSPILVAMKPNEGTYANNALKYGVSGLNIDGGRIEGEPWSRPTTADITGGNYGNSKGEMPKPRSNNKGRFPANFILECTCGSPEDLAMEFHNNYEELAPRFGYETRKDTKNFDKESPNGKLMIEVCKKIINQHANPECPCYMLDKQSGELSSGGRHGVHKGGNQFNVGGLSKKPPHPQSAHFDKGGASRFFYTAKASKSERGACNTHPTVKPLKLMEYLCKITKTPTGGIVLDPFAGSFTTCLAAQNIGRDWIGLEMDEDYCKIGEKRLEQEVLF